MTIGNAAPPFSQSTVIKMDNDNQIALMNVIDEKIGEVRTEAIDLTFGEIVNLKTQNEIRIDPDYQRLFRWSSEQKSRLVEVNLASSSDPARLFCRE